MKRETPLFNHDPAALRLVRPAQPHLLRPACGITFRGRANIAHVRQSRPDSGLGFQVKVLKFFLIVPSSLVENWPWPIMTSSCAFASSAPRSPPTCAPGFERLVCVRSFPDLAVWVLAVQSRIWPFPPQPCLLCRACGITFL